MAGVPWSDAEDRTLQQLHAQGLSMNEIARRMGRAKGTISKHCPRLGITWDRTRTNAATKAHQDDARARRARLQVDLLSDAERLRKQIWAPTVAFNFGGRDNTYNEHPLDQPTFADQLKIVQAVGVAVDKSVRLAEHDAAAGAEQVVGLLQATAAALGLTDSIDQQPPAQTGEAPE